MFIKREKFFNLLLAALLAILFLILLSCEGGSGETFPAAVSDTAASSEAGTVSGDETSRRIETTRKVVLVRGNQWVNGFPGFGVNSFSALAGEYRLSPRAAGETESGVAGDFLVYLTTESLYFSGEWQPLPPNPQILQRSSEDALLTAVMIDDGHGSSWIAVFVFPHGIEKTGLSGSAFDQLIRVWTGRFIYFLSLSKIIGDVSLPAVVEF